MRSAQVPANYVPEWNPQRELRFRGEPKSSQRIPGLRMSNRSRPAAAQIQAATTLAQSIRSDKRHRRASHARTQGLSGRSAIGVSANTVFTCEISWLTRRGTERRAVTA